MTIVFFFSVYYVSFTGFVSKPCDLFTDKYELLICTHTLYQKLLLLLYAFFFLLTICILHQLCFVLLRI